LLKAVGGLGRPNPPTAAVLGLIPWALNMPALLRDIFFLDWLNPLKLAALCFVEDWTRVLFWLL